MIPSSSNNNIGREPIWTDNNKVIRDVVNNIKNLSGSDAKAEAVRNLTQEQRELILNELNGNPGKMGAKKKVKSLKV